MEVGRSDANERSGGAISALSSLYGVAKTVPTAGKHLGQTTHGLAYSGAGSEQRTVTGCILSVCKSRSSAKE